MSDAPDDRDLGPDTEDRAASRWRPGGFESDDDPARRRTRTLVFVGIPTLAASVVVLLLGLPWWLLLGFLVLFGLIVLTSS